MDKFRSIACPRASISCRVTTTDIIEARPLQSVRDSGRPRSWDIDSDLREISDGSSLAEK